MLRTGLVIDERYTLHEASPHHPERPERIETLIAATRSYRREGIARVAPRAATREEILQNHDLEYFEEVAASARREFTVFDADTQANAHTFDAALLAAGGVLSLVDGIMRGELDNGFALVRPPGHHAESGRAMGFCFFNNVAIAARHLREAHGLDRVLIVDWDVHHGNGTERSFFAQRDVMYVSLHQYPFYPGTGAVTDIGVGDGVGFTVNIPFPAGQGDAEYAQAFDEIIVPIARKYQPQFVLVSAGFDAHESDPLGGMRVTRDGFHTMTRDLMDVAQLHAADRLALVLEGGYNLEALSESVVSVLDGLGGEAIDSAPRPAGAAGAVIAEVARVQRRFWKL